MAASPTQSIGPIRVNRVQIAMGVTSLVMGVFVYLLARPRGSVWFVPAALRLDVPLPRVPWHAASSLPTFAHALGFSLLSAGVVASRKWGGAIICAAWFLLDTVFELGQRPDVSAWLVPRLPAWFDHVWLLANAKVYFARGTFDPSDIAAGAAGAALAYFVICHTQAERIAS